MMNLTLTHGFSQFSLNIQCINNDHLHTRLVQAKFNMVTLYFDNHYQFLAADRSPDLTCPGLAEPNSRLARVSVGQCQNF